MKRWLKNSFWYWIIILWSMLYWYLPVDWLTLLFVSPVVALIIYPVVSKIRETVKF